jgi:hypothetical protein
MRLRPSSTVFTSTPSINSAIDKRPALSNNRGPRSSQNKSIHPAFSQGGFMKKTCFVDVLAWLSISFLLFSLQALAQENGSHVRVHVTPSKHSLAVPNTGDGVLVPLAAGFSALPPQDGNGYDEWPCQPANPDADNDADCSSIAAGGLVIGTPAYTWSLADCDADTPTSTNCGQVFWSYEDDTGDNTDDLVVSIVAKQGTAVLLDTGDINLGVNTAAVGSIVVLSQDAAFGTLGATGKNNGYCAGSKKVCSNPLPTAPITIVVTTDIGRYKLMKSFKIVLQ